MLDMLLIVFCPFIIIPLRADLHSCDYSIL